VLTINTEDKKLYDEHGVELSDIASSFTPQKLEFIKAGGSYAIVFGKKLQGFACDTLGYRIRVCLCLIKANFS
jgi:aconitate hydratase 2/2-methylisocitrate dehydratase